MVPPDALDVLIVSHEDDPSEGDFPCTRDFVEVLRTVFRGSGGDEVSREHYLVGGLSTGVTPKSFVVRDGVTLPPDPAALDVALHSLVIVLASEQFTADGACMTAVAAVAAAVRASGGRHELIVFGLSDRATKDLRNRALVGDLAAHQSMDVEQLGEYALRPAYAALWALARSLRLLTAGRPNQPIRKPCFFISHTKLDALPLAQSLLHIIGEFRWLDAFYDALNIEPGDDFESVLQHGVRDSLLLVLRTDIYDHRPWCQQEVRWAEQHDCPVLLVEARAQLLCRPSSLGFTGVPAVRIPDGNLVRVLGEALREWVRISVLRRRFQALAAIRPAITKEAALICRPPTNTALFGAVDRLKAAGAGEKAILVHSEPALERVEAEAAQRLWRSEFPEGSVLRWESFVAHLP